MDSDSFVVMLLLHVLASYMVGAIVFYMVIVLYMVGTTVCGMVN